MLNILKICLTLLFIDFALCVVTDGNIYHFKAADNENFEYVFTVDGLPKDNFYRDYRFELFKAQGEKDIQPNPSTYGRSLANSARRLRDEYKAENDRITFTLIEPSEDKQPYKFPFKILNVEPKDAGIYTFEVKDDAANKIVFTKKLIIYVHSKPEEITFYGGNLNINFTAENKQSSFINFNESEGQLICEGSVTGYKKNNIKWDFKVEIEGEDNEKLFDPGNFEVQTNVKLVGDTPGMQVPKTSLVSKFKKFKPDPKYSGKLITCTLPDWEFQDLSISSQKTIRIRGRPNVYGPINPIGGVLTKEGVVFAEVVSSPEVSTHEWKFNDEKIKETADMKFDKKCAVENDAQKCNFTITFSKVMSSYYGNYKFSATNTFGTSERIIKFMDEKEKATSNECNKVIPSVTMLIFIVLLIISS